MPRLFRMAAIVGVWLCLLPTANACPWLYPWAGYPTTAYLEPYPPPLIVRGCAPCQQPLPGPGPCPVNGSPRPPIPLPAHPLQAVPTPAPPSASIEPPLADPPGTPPPSIHGDTPPPLAPPNPPPAASATSTAKAANYPSAADADPYFFDTYIRTARTGERKPGGPCVVSFQNLTGREATLDVAGQHHVLSVGETWRVEPPRQFVWCMAGRPAQSEAVSTNLVGLEIVLRR